MTRQERIDQACKDCFISEDAARKFRQAADLWQDCYVYWNTQEDERFAILEKDNLSIEFYEIT